MNFQPAAPRALTGKQSLFRLLLAVACFQAAYTCLRFPAAGLFIIGYAFALVRLTNQPTPRRAFYFGLAAGFFSYAPQFFFFWNIFQFAAIVLWIILAFWVALFALLANRCAYRWGPGKAAWLIPVLWTGLEYFRSEIYYLKFSWGNLGYALPPGANFLGMYGTGFVTFLAAAWPFRYVGNMKWLQLKWVEWLIIFPVTIIFVAVRVLYCDSRNESSATLTGVQMEFPATGVVPKALDHALAKNPDSQIFVLSEYTCDGPVPDPLKSWCRQNRRFLVVGAKDIVTNDVYYNTAFVIGTNGEIVFKQAKSVPIQFFHDGLPAPKQELWNSPWGKIGICICYDLSFTRVTDRLVAQGAQLLIVPTMDVMEWGRHQHELHSRVAPVRAAEYGLPIFRLASSGISQAVTGQGEVIAQTHIGGQDETLTARLSLPACGTLPIDCYLAPGCTIATAGILICLMVLAWKEKPARK